jgi:TPR repeat protein
MFHHSRVQYTWVGKDTATRRLSNRTGLSVLLTMLYLCFSLVASANSPELINQYTNALRAYNNSNYLGAYTLIKPLAETNAYSFSPSAKYLLAQLHHNGQGTPQDGAKALALYKASFETSIQIHDKKNAAFALGLIYHDGILIQKDLKKAAKWFSFGAELQSKPSRGFLKRLLARPDVYVEINRGEFRSQNQNNNKAELEDLKRLYAKKEYEKVYEIARRHALSGNREAQDALSQLYWNGQGVKKSRVNASRWIYLAAKNGLPFAQFKLGTMYNSGEIVPYDREVGLMWLGRAADQGHAMSENDLAVALINPPAGEEPKIDEAIRLFEKSANRGFHMAQINLGDFYSEGKYVGKDPDQAILWYRMAANQGNKKALDKLASLGASTTVVAAQESKKIEHAPLAPQQLTIPSNSPSQDLVKAVQKRLMDLGFNPGKIDGIYGRRVRAAIEAFQRSHTASVNGEPSDDLLRQLNEQAENSKTKTSASNNATAPTIDIQSKITVQSDSAMVRGRVSSNNIVAQVTIEGLSVDLDTNGSFSFTRYVPVGGTTIRIEAVDEWGNRSKRTVNITRAVAKVADQFVITSLDPTKIKGRSNKDAIALIIGVATYSSAPAATFADNDANVFGDYAHRALGIPRSNIKMMVNDKASLVGTKVAVKRWLRGRIEEGKTDVHVFFAGHGLASPDGESLYLLPYDGEASLLDETALLRRELFAVIDKAKPKSATIFLDTCYSGLSRGKETLLASARGIIITAKPKSVPNGFTVFSAASGQQISSGLNEAKHGLFSYYLMKGMEGGADANGDKKITAGELHAYLGKNVQKQAIRLGREQTPELSGDGERVLVAW